MLEGIDKVSSRLKSAAFTDRFYRFRGLSQQFHGPADTQGSQVLPGRIAQMMGELAGKIELAVSAGFRDIIEGDILHIMGSDIAPGIDDGILGGIMLLTKQDFIQNLEEGD